MNQILDMAGKPLRARKARRRPFKKEDVRDLGKIATILAVIAIGYFQFAPENRDGSAQSVAMAGE